MRVLNLSYFKGKGMRKILMILSILVFCSQTAHAYFSPVGFSFTHKGVDGQFPKKDWDVYGVRVNVLSAEHRRVVGMDFGVINTTTEYFAGAALGLINANDKSTRILGLQFGLFSNYNKGDTKGLGIQGSLFSNHNKGPAHLIGMQMAIANTGQNNIYGLQMGVYNRADRIVGLQMGVVNYCSNLHGFQIGLLNICKSCLIGIMPGVNIGF